MSTSPLRRALPALGLSSLVAFAVVGVLWGLVQSYEAELAEATRPPATLDVVYAVRDVPPGLAITRDDLAVRAIEVAWVPEQVFADPDELVGRVPAERLVGGEAVRAERLADPAGGAGLDAIVPRGQRALALPLANGAAVSGFVEPGNFVDVLVTIRGEHIEEMRTRTLLQTVRVLAVNNRVSRDQDEGVGQDGQAHAPSVIVSVTPEEAAILSHAVNAGRLSLSLRNGVDLRRHTSDGATATRIIGRPEDIVAFVAPPERRVVSPPVADTRTWLEIWRGTVKSEVETLPDGTLKPR